MTIGSLKELQKLIQLCRKLGVSDMKVDGLEFHLGDPPKTKANISKPVFLPSAPEENIPVPQYNGTTAESIPDIDTPDELSQEQLLFYSAQGHVEQ